MTLLEMSLAGALIILAAALIRALGKDRLPLWSFEALWALACLRLLAPVRLPWRFSVWAALDRASAAVPAAVPAVPGTALPDGPLVDMIQTPAIAAPSAPTLSPWTVAWAAGACALALAFAVSYVRARRRFRASEAVQDGPIGQWTAACPLRRRVSVRLSDRIAAPLTYGLFRPVILLPRSMDRTDSGTLGYVLAHELAHIRRFDAARKLVLAAAVCLHWFDPAVWLMLVLAGRDMERSCDRAVLDAYGADARADYARALLTLEERRADLGMASGFAKNAIEERIHSIMKIRPRSFFSALLALVLVLAVGSLFATAAPEDEAVIGGADGPTDVTVSDAPSTVLSGDVMASSDGTIYVFTADGKPVSMTQQEYKLLFQPVEVEWWTAEEYAAWLEQEKKDLQDCLGQRAWTNADGWFTWTQEKIDETIQMYEQILVEIENGLLVSKTVDGSSDVALMQGDGDARDTLFDSTEDGIVMYKYDDDDTGWTIHAMTEDEAVAMQEQNGAIAAQRQQLEEQLSQLDEERAQIEQKLASIAEAEEQTERLAGWEDVLAPYAPFGVTYKYNEQTDDVELYWNGQRVRGIYDGTAGVWISEHSGNGTWPEGTRELIAQYTDGELTGLHLATEEEQAQWDRLREQSGASPDPTGAVPPAEAETDEIPAEAVQPMLESDGTVTVPPDENVTVFFEQADGAPYGRLESGGPLRVGQATVAGGSTVSVSLTTRTDAALTVSLRGGADSMGQSAQLKAGQAQTVTFSPEKADTYGIYLTNNGEYPVEFIASWIVS